MAENNLRNPDSDIDDDLVPTFSKILKKYVYENGVEFECNILTSDKINKERSFKGFFINDNDEEE
jgi:hypothetical protein